MSKKFKGKPCAYCLSNPSTRTGDHVFAREFFMPDKRDNLPKVPACERCNNEKSRLEHYLTAVLPFGGNHADASAALTGMVPDRLAKNVRLHRELAEGSGRALVEATAGPPQPTLTIPFDGQILVRLFDYIVRGLVFHHWGVTLGEQHGVRLIILTRAGEDAFARFFCNMNMRQQVIANLGDGTFRYIGKQGDQPELTVWGFDVYGGPAMAGDPEAPNETARGIAAITATREFLGRKAITDIFGEEPAPREEGAEK